LENGDELDADLVIIGVGCSPRTKFAKNVVKTDDKGGVIVDPFL
jgi:NADPH-dependent 2,4-dienoyl-CoA reductase/sulfur reductase-like enzyme